MHEWPSVIELVPAAHRMRQNLRIVVLKVGFVFARAKMETYLSNNVNLKMQLLIRKSSLKQLCKVSIFNMVFIC